MRSSSPLVSVLFALLTPLVVTADLAPFFDPNKKNENLTVFANVDGTDSDEKNDTSRKLKELKSRAIERRRELIFLDRGYDSSDLPARLPVGGGMPLMKGGKRGKGGKGEGGQKQTKKKSKDGKPSKGKGGKGGKGGAKGGGYGDSEDEIPCICHYEDSGDSPCLCNEGGDRPPTVDLEFVLIRDEVGTPDADDDFGLASSLGLNGYVYDILVNNAEEAFGDRPIGVFKGFCTVVSVQEDALFCTYEIYLYTSGPHEMGAVIVSGPIQGPENKSIVTGAEFDFGGYDGGSMTTLQDPENPILYAYLSLN